MGFEQNILIGYWDSDFIDSEQKIQGSVSTKQPLSLKVHEMGQMKINWHNKTPEKSSQISDLNLCCILIKT